MTERKENRTLREKREARRTSRSKKEKRPVGRFFFLEQVTRVELAGNSLGSCRHTARRHLLLAVSFNSFFIIRIFFSNVNGFSFHFSFFYAFSISRHSLHVPKNSNAYPSIINSSCACVFIPPFCSPITSTSANFPHITHRPWQCGITL